MTELTDRLQENALQISGAELGDWGLNLGGYANDFTEAADEIARLSEEVKSVRSEMGCAYREVARFEIALGEEETKADALAEAVKYNLMSLRAVNAGAKYRGETEPVPPETVEELEAALTAYQNKEVIQGEVGKEVLPAYGGDNG